MKRVTIGLGVGILALVVLVGALFPLTGYDYSTDAHHLEASLPPSAEHWLGTDHNGRDVLSRALLACRYVAFPGLLACVVAALVAVPTGAIAGYAGGPVAAGIRYLFGVVSSIPRFVLVLLVCTIYGDSLVILAIAAGIAYAPTLAEAVFSRIEEMRSAEYVIANRAHGVPEWRIVAVHLVWASCRRLVGRHLLTLFGYFIVLEATLSYLGKFGVPGTLPSWGKMLTQDWFREDVHWVTAVVPVVAILAVVAAVGWAREGLREGRRD